MERKRFKYSEESVKKALASIKNGMPIRTASRTYQTPYSTLACKHRGIYPVARKIGPETVLTPEKENQIVRWMLHVSSSGFPVTKYQLLDSVEMH